MTFLQKGDKFYKVISYDKEGGHNVSMMVNQRYQFCLELLPRNRQDSYNKILNNKNVKATVPSDCDRFKTFIKKAEEEFFFDNNLDGLDIKTFPLWWHLPLPE